VVSCFLMRTSLLEVELVRGMVVHGGGRQCWDLWLAGDGMTTCPANGDVAARQRRPKTGDIVARLSGKRGR
jgi:hypothetical protein